MKILQISEGKISLFRYLLLHLLLLVAVSTPLSARNNCPDQGPRLSADEYCRLYAAEAQRQMSLYGIPASITLAQGMFESGYGSSYIAVIGNNHFGIKAYRDWTGPTIQCDDDSNAEPFCKFNSVKESFEHHSKFLRNSTRYSSLFKLSSQDYKGWAKGLRECGYATSKTYPERLIDLIERYGLDKYDKGEISSAPSTSVGDAGSRPASSKPSSGVTSGTPKPAAGVSFSVSTRHKLYSTSASGGLKYVRANKGDYLFIISQEFGISERKLRKYNEMTKYYRLKEGEVVYLQAKKSHADRSHPWHVVREGESLHSIAQKYGVTVSSLVKRNNLRSGVIQVGQTLKLR